MKKENVNSHFHQLDENTKQNWKFENTEWETENSANPAQLQSGESEREIM